MQPARPTTAVAWLFIVDSAGHLFSAIVEQLSPAALRNERRRGWNQPDQRLPSRVFLWSIPQDTFSPLL
ncbi:MAG: hypothetical protein O2931_13330 [Planctomycetota bacterium]|nr:hypothetical protein [Planctomycetota bacterium]